MHSMTRAIRHLIVIQAATASAVLLLVTAAHASADDTGGSDTTSGRGAATTSVQGQSDGPARQSGAAAPNASDPVVPQATDALPNEPIPPADNADVVVPIPWEGGHNKCTRKKGGRDYLPWCAETNRWSDMQAQRPAPPRPTIRTQG